MPIVFKYLSIPLHRATPDRLCFLHVPRARISCSLLHLKMSFLNYSLRAFDMHFILKATALSILETTYLFHDENKMSIVSSLKGREMGLSFHLAEYICKSFKVTLDMLLFYKEGCKKTGFMNNRYMIHYHKKAVKTSHIFQTMLKDLEVSPAFYILNFMSNLCKSN